MNKRFISVAAPVFAGNEEQYVLDCIKSTWISSNGPYIQKFEDMFANFCSGREDATNSIKIAERQLRRIYR